MSKILVSLLLLTFFVYPVLAEESTTSTNVRKPAIQQKINIRQEKVASRTATLKAKLQTFKDQKKAEIADRVNNNFNKINQNQTTQMQKNLGTMSTILDRLEARVNQGTPDIKDPVAAKAAIASAKATIATASAAVTAQTQKDYTVQVTSEAKIKTDVKTQRDKLFADLKASRKVVIDAKQSVANAIRIAKSGEKESEIKEGTSSGKQ